MSTSRHVPHLLAPAFAGQRHRVIFLDFDGVLHPLHAINGAKPPLQPHEILQAWPATFQHLNRPGFRGGRLV